jgi:predicted ester cyclase
MSSEEHQVMSSEEHQAIVWRAYDTTFNKKHPAGARDCYSNEYIGHMPHHPEPIGIDELEAEGDDIIAAVPDVAVIFDDVIGAGDRLVVRHTFTGTHQGAWMGIPPTGKKITFSGTDIYRFVNGKVAEEWAQPDIFGVLHQLGVIPAPSV